MFIIMQEQAYTTEAQSVRTKSRSMFVNKALFINKVCLALIRPKPGTLVKLITITFKIILSQTGRLLSLFMSEK